MAIQIGRRGTRLVLILALFSFSLLIFSCNGKKTKEAYPVSQTPGGPFDPVLVKKLFDVKCALCHGYDGKQQYAGAKNLGESTLSMDEVIHQIKNGKGAMPPQKDVLSDEQIQALSEFVFTLRNK